MRTRYRRSILQTEILTSLQDHSASSIAALAQDINHTRPSVSRSLHTLVEQGFVQRDGRGWRLTDAGLTEAKAAEAKLQASTTETLELVGRQMNAARRLGMDPTLESRMRSLLSPAIGGDLVGEALRHVDTSASLRAAVVQPVEQSMVERLNEATWQQQSALDAITTRTPGLDAYMEMLEGGAAAIIQRSIAAELADAISPMVAAQQDYSEILSLSPAVQEAAPQLGIDLVAKQTDLFAQAIDNLFALQRAEMVLLDKPTVFATFSWIPEHLTAVSTSLADLFEDEVSQIRYAASESSLARAAERMVLVTAPVTSYTAGIRALVEAEEELVAPSRLVPTTRRSGDDSLDVRLAALHPDLVEMRHGSWHALNTRGPDFLRHAGVSQRALLDHVLQILVPTDDLPEGQRQGPCTKARTKKALGGSNTDADYVVALSQAMYRSYEQLSAYTHGNEKHEESLYYLLCAGEGLLGFLLVNMVAQKN